jgi:hypothetical protein
MAFLPPFAERIFAKYGDPDFSTMKKSRLFHNKKKVLLLYIIIYAYGVRDFFEKFVPYYSVLRIGNVLMPIRIRPEIGQS